MSDRTYLDDETAPEAVQMDKDLRWIIHRTGALETDVARLTERMTAMEKRVEELEALTRRQKTKIAFLEGAHRV